ncbi:MAG: hypothetical protein J2P56_11045 [Verrucomicrobia bacterium]|nr:hypothetical protein [Verrucomicrobiota bacterium]
MARKCDAPGCGFPLPDRYPLDKCPWHMAPGRGPVKIAAALTIAAAGFGGGFAYKRFRRYLDERKLRKEREESKKTAASKGQKAKSPARKRSTKSQKRPRTRKKAATKSKEKPAEPATS